MATQREKISSYELFMAAVSILSIVNLVLVSLSHALPIKYVIVSIDVFLSILFLGDFLKQFIKAPSKRHYFFREFGWADLLASIPFPQFKILRVFRLIKAYTITKRVGFRNVVREFFRNRAQSALYLIFFLIILLLEFASIAILYVEGTDPVANIHTASDAIWWVYVTITTVGYGDQYPVTNLGRGIGMLVMLAGVGLFGVLTGFLANKFVPSSDESEAKLDKMQRDLDEIKSLLKKR
ncbi:ion transporter [Candidatus Saccharibacteria bacterium]|nr:MAG: ion transporter [Candidatus Saccharibacteria bacterium]